MEFNLTKYTPNKKALNSWGFKEDGHLLISKTKFNDELFLKININEDFSIMKVDVFDYELEDKFQPFYLTIDSMYSNKIKFEVKTMCLTIISDCFFENDIKQKIMNYCKDNFDSFQDHPFSKSPDFIAYKINNSNKWFALFFNAPYNKINKHISSDEKIDILNLKIDSEEAIKFFDGKSYFEGYHMNHLKWLTIYLNKDLDFEVVKKLINMSYKNVTKK